MIVVFGTVCLDRIRQILRMPAAGEYVEVDSEALMLGGEAANTTSHLRRWGVSAELWGNAIAADAIGVRLEALLAERGMSQPQRAARTDATPVCDVYVTPDGERTMFGVGFRAMVVPDVATFQPTPGGWFTTDGNFGATAEAYANKAHAGGMRLYLMDLPPTSALLGPGVIWHTSTRWIGQRGNQSENAKLVQAVVDRTGCTAILTDAGRGLLVASPSKPARMYPVFSRPSVLDSTGAGDALRAGVLYGLDSGWPQCACLRFGAAAAALAAAFIGAAEGPTLGAVEAHLAAHSDVASQYA
ncbi:MAG: carbohydrate kinase family protein [Fimbriimonadaceae bacterium]